MILRFRHHSPEGKGEDGREKDEGNLGGTGEGDGEVWRGPGGAEDDSPGYSRISIAALKTSGSMKIPRIIM